MTPPGRRRPLAVVVGLVVGLVVPAVLAGCASIPSEGPVVDARRVEGVGSGLIQLFPSGPSSDAGPGTLVREFLRAASTFRNDHEVARRFLSSARRVSWRPESPVVVYANESSLTVSVRRGGVTVQDLPAAASRAEGRSVTGTGSPAPSGARPVPSGSPSGRGAGTASAPPPPSPAATDDVLTAAPGPGERAQVTLQVPVQSTVDRTGQYTTALPGTVVTRTFDLVGTMQGWRIDGLEPGILVSRYDFDSTFRGLPLYFADPTGTYLVPDVRWFPVAGSTTTPSQLLSALLDGPADWLRPAVTTGSPPDTMPTVNSVKIEAGVATVDLTSQARRADARQRLVLKAQLERTLASLGPADNPVTSVVVTVEQQRFELLPAGNAITARPDTVGDQTRLRPPPQVDPRPVVLDARGAIARLSGRTVSTVPGLAALEIPGAVEPATDTAGQAYAVLVEGRRRLVSAVPYGPAIPLIAGRDLVAPSLDPFGWVWTAQRVAGTSVLAARPGAGHRFVHVPWLSGHQVLSLRISREGARAVVVARRRDGRPAVFVAGVVRTPQGVPTELTPPVVLLADAQEAIAAAWVDATHVVVLARRPGSALMPWICEVGGEAHGTLPVQAVTVTAGNSESDLYVQTPAGTVRSRVGSSWSDVPGVRWPAMPG
jgi:hypothetical protein